MELKFGELQCKVERLETALKEEQSSKQKIQQVLKQQGEDLHAVKSERDSLEERLRKLTSLNQSMRQRVEEYSRCCQELNVHPGLTEYDRYTVSESPETLTSDGILVSALRQLKSDHAQWIRKVGDLAERHQTLIHAHRDLIQRYQMDSGQYEASTASVRQQLDATLHTLALTQRERDDAWKLSENQGRDLAVLHERYKSLTRTQLAEHDQTVFEFRQKLDQFQQQWSTERDQMINEIQQLRQSKVDLQCEIGLLLRNKRSTEVELHQAIEHLQIQSDAFRADILGSLCNWNFTCSKGNVADVHS